jgi:hypothetical protein
LSTRKQANRVPARFLECCETAIWIDFPWVCNMFIILTRPNMTQKPDLSEFGPSGEARDLYVDV